MAQLPYGTEVSGQLVRTAGIAEDTAGSLKVFFSYENNPTGLPCPFISISSSVAAEYLKNSPFQNGPG